MNERKYPWLADDGWTDSLFERIVVTVVVWCFILAPFVFLGIVLL